MPLQNRVTPLSRLVATPERGLVYGNRGCLHDAEGRIRRSYNGKRWIACRLRFGGRHRRRLMQPGRYTELFFLDEATAFAAGHRPCAECRREDYVRLTAIWNDLHPGQVGADAIDAQLHGERVVPGTRAQRHHEAAFDELPDGAFVLHRGEPFLVLGRELLRWTPGGYLRGGRRPAGGTAVAITPLSLLSVLRTDWQPVVPLLHPSAMRVSAPSRCGRLSRGRVRCPVRRSQRVSFMATSEQIPSAAGEDVEAHRQASREAADAGVRFLAEAGEALAASLDWEATLVRVAQLTVPALADWCIVDVLESDGATIHQVAVAAVDPGKEDLLREMRLLYPPTIDSPQPAARALRAGEAVVFREFDPESLASTVRDERHLELITKLAPRAAMAVPLVARGHTLGALTLSWSESEREYGEAEVALAEGLASRAALAVDNAMLFAREREARADAEEAVARLRDLEVISEAALAHLDLDGLLRNLLQGIRRIMRVDTAVALLLDEKREELVARWSKGLEEDIEAGKRVRVPLGRGFAGRVAQERRPVFIPDVGKAELLNPLLPQKGLKSLLGVPLLVEGRLLGVLHVGTMEPRLFGEQDERTLQLLADRVSLAIEQSRLYEDERAASRRLEFLAEASELLGSTLDHATALRRLSTLAVPYLGNWCLIDIVDPSGRLERLAVAHSDPERLAEDAAFRERFPPTLEALHGPGYVIRTGRPELIHEVTEDHLREASGGDQKRLAGLREIGMTSSISLPLMARGRVLGALTLLSDRPERLYGPEDLATAEELGRRVAVAVDNARLFDEAERRGDAARVLEHVADGVFLIDADGLVRHWNRAAEAMTLLGANEVVGRAAADAIPGWALIVDRVPVTRAPAAAVRAETLPLQLPDRELWLSIVGADFGDGTVYAFRDLTEERVLEELRADFVSTVSHELRTPLAAIYGAALTLQRDDLRLDDAQRERLLAMISGESDRLARTVNDILWASKLDADRLPITIGSYDAEELTRTVVDVARLHLPPDIELSLELEPDLPPVAADPDKVRQVLTNLVDNAIKYSPDGGSVEVEVARRDHALRFSVRDRGLGIAQGEQRRIFEKFYRVDPNLTRGVGGTGLGLYICRELVRRMNGTIWVESRERDGSLFTFELPAA